MKKIISILTLASTALIATSAFAFDVINLNIHNSTTLQPHIRIANAPDAHGAMNVGPSHVLYPNTETEMDFGALNRFNGGHYYIQYRTTAGNWVPLRAESGQILRIREQTTPNDQHIGVTLDIIHDVANTRLLGECIGANRRLCDAVN